MTLFNPYLDLFKILQSLPESQRLEARKKLIWAYSWAVPSTEAILKICEYSPILELGAGTGYWGWLIRQAGGKIRCLDHQPHQPPRWLEIESSDSSVDFEDPHISLLLCWPPLNTCMASQALERFQGDTLLFIGEWRGRTGDLNFHDQLEKSWTIEETLLLPQWPGFYDHLYILKRNRSILSHFSAD